MSERHGLPDVYPLNREDFVVEQAAKARWVVYKGVSDGSEWHLVDGALLEIWPGGYVFNEFGTVVGRFELIGYGEPPSRIEERRLAAQDRDLG